MTKKMIGRFWITVVGIALTLSASVFAQGPILLTPGGGGGAGAGNGGIGEVEVYQDQVRRDAQHAHDWEEWCANAAAVLNRAVNRANRLLGRSDREGAENILANALISLDQTEGTPASVEATPMTRKLVRRGVLLWRALEEFLPVESTQYRVSRLNFLFEYAKLVIQAENSVDRKNYYRYIRGEHCEDSVLRELEIEIAALARDQLKWANSSFAEIVKVVRGNDSWEEARPVGSPRVLFKVAEILADAIARDLRNNLFAARYRLLASDLRLLAEDLADQNDRCWRQTRSGDWYTSGAWLTFGEVYSALAAAHQHLSEKLPVTKPAPCREREDDCYDRREYQILPVRR